MRMGKGLTMSTSYNNYWRVKMPTHQLETKGVYTHTRSHTHTLYSLLLLSTRSLMIHLVHKHMYNEKLHFKHLAVSYVSYSVKCSRLHATYNGRRKTWWGVLNLEQKQSRGKKRKSAMRPKCIQEDKQQTTRVKHETICHIKWKLRKASVAHLHDHLVSEWAGNKKLK